MPVLDEEILSEAISVLGSKTDSAAVNTALRETIRVRRLLGVSQFFCKGLWEGDLSVMREDQTLRDFTAIARYTRLEIAEPPH